MLTEDDKETILEYALKASKDFPGCSAEDAVSFGYELHTAFTERSVFFEALVKSDERGVTDAKPT